MTGWLGYKAFRVRKDGSLGPLFVERRRRLPRERWLKADLSLRPKGLAHRPGWHVVLRAEPPAHISLKGRVWVQVRWRGWMRTLARPERQGGAWVTAKEIWIP